MLSHKKLLKSISLATALFVCVHESAGAAVADGLIHMPSKEPGSFALPHIPSQLPISTPVISDKLGTVIKHQKPQENGHVFLIQDYHVNEHAQSRIAEIIDYLTREYQTQTVITEGASGEISHAPLSLFPSRKVRSIGARALLRSGLISAAEYLTITKRPALRLFGAEDPELYNENRRALLSISKHRDDHKKSLTELKRTLKALEVLILSDAARDWLYAKDAFQQSPEKLINYIYFLTEHCPTAESCQGTQFNHLLQSDKLTKEINFAELLASIKKINMRESGLRNAWEVFKTKLTLAELRNAPANMDIWSPFLNELKQYSDNTALIGFLSWLHHVSSVNIDIYNEIKTIEALYSEALFKTEKASRLNRLHLVADTYEALFDMAFTSDKAVFFDQNRDEFKASSIFAELEYLRGNHTIPLVLSPETLKPLESSASEYFDFYHKALKRDRVLAKNTVTYMQSRQTQSAILITGGFHTAGIERELTDMGVGFTTFMPEIGKAINVRQTKEIYDRAISLSDSDLIQMVQSESSKALNPLMQLHVPSRLPTLAKLEAFNSQDISAASGHFIFLMLFETLFQVTGEKSFLPYTAEDLDQMTPGERNLIDFFYRGFSRDGFSARRESKNTGRILFPFHEDLQLSAEASWKKSATPVEPGVWIKNQRDLKISLPGNVVLTLHFIHEEAQYDVLKRQYAGRSELRAEDNRPEPEPQSKTVNPGALFAEILRLFKIRTDDAPRETSAVQELNSLPDDELIRQLDNNEKAALADSSTINRLINIYKSRKQISDDSPEESAYQNNFSPALTRSIEILLISFLAINAGPSGIAAALTAIVMTRLGFSSALLIHEWSHMIAATGKGAWSLKNTLGNRNIGEWLSGLVPFQPLVSEASIKTELPSNTFWVKHAGWLGGFLYFSALSFGLYFTQASLWAYTFTLLWPGAAYFLYRGFISDAIAPADSPCLHGCGNQGVLIKAKKRGKSLLPRSVEDLLERMGKVTKVRGEQAAGRVVMTTDGLTQVQLVNAKRADLAEALKDASRKALKKQRTRQKRSTENYYLAMEHYRYGTSSAPSAIETHPHIWTKEKRRPVYLIENGRIVKQKRNVSHAITHNGDFDSWELFGTQVPVDILALWLERVLHFDNNTEGDSPKIAGMMDLLLTQGRWDESVRLAYQLQVARSVSDAFGGVNPEPVWREIVRSFPIDTPYVVLKKEFNRRMPANSAPSEENLELHAGLFEDAFTRSESFQKLSQLDNLEDVPVELRLELIDQITMKLAGNQHFRHMDQDALKRYIETAVNAFFANNAYHAVRLFLSRAMGSFGLVVLSSLEPAQFVTAAKGQPISLGFDPQADLIAYASEAAALKVPGENGNIIPYRLDLDQFAGEIAEVNLEGVRLFSERQGREITREELAYSGRIIDTRDNELVEPLTTFNSDDVVGDDIRDIPKVADSIRKDWRNENSFNYQTAQALLDQLKRKIENPAEKAGPGKLDILFAGIEISQWLGEQMAEDLQRIYPDLNIGTISGNKILESIQDGNLNQVDENTIVLFISQSGQTFPSLNAVTALTAVYSLQQQLPGRVFALTGEMDTPLGAALGQYYYKGAPFGKRIFTNGSGRRPAEPSSVAAVAAHATLTELLLFIIRELPKATGEAKPFGQKLERRHLKNLLDIRDSVIDRGLISIVGQTPRGDRVQSPENESLSRLGKKWGRHVLESALTWGISAVIVFITVVVTGPILTALYSEFALPFLSNTNPLVVTALTYSVKIIDALVLIFLSWILALTLRLNPAAPRELLARTGKRTVVIGDLPFIHQSLEQFVSKLFSMSFGHASIEVHGANPRDHMLHRFGHRVVRGTLLLLGVPDGRLEAFSAAENNVLMTAKQGKGVRNQGVGAEVVTIAHRPINNPNASDQEVTLWSHLDDIPLERTVQLLYDSRFASLERWVSAFVFFYSMAHKVSRFRPLRYDMSRTQSGTRIATTAAPVSAAAISSIVKANSKGVEKQRVLEQPATLPFKVRLTGESKNDTDPPLQKVPAKKDAEQDVQKMDPIDPQETLRLVKRITLMQYKVQMTNALLKGFLQAQKTDTKLDAESFVRNATAGWWEAARGKIEEKDLSEAQIQELEDAVWQAAEEMIRTHKRSELRESLPEDLISALNGASRMQQQVQLSSAFDFKPILSSYSIETDEFLNLLDNMIKAAEERPSPSQASGQGGEIIYLYKDRLHQNDFSENFGKAVTRMRGIQKITLIRDPSTSEANWKNFKNGLLSSMTNTGIELDFHENNFKLSFVQLMTLLFADRKADFKQATQIIAPDDIKEDQRDYYDKAMIAAAALGRETILLLGSNEALTQIKRVEFQDMLHSILTAYQHIAVSA